MGDPLFRAVPKEGFVARIHKSGVHPFPDALHIAFIQDAISEKGILSAFVPAFVSTLNRPVKVHCHALYW